MKKLLIALALVGVALYVYFVVLKPAPVTTSPTPTPTPTPTATRQANITVTAPRPGDMVNRTFTVTGTERTFEQGVVLRVYDSTGTKLLEEHTTGTGMGDGTFGPYSFTVTIPPQIKGALEIWVFDYSAKDGSIIELVKVPVTLK